MARVILCIVCVLYATIMLAQGPVQWQCKARKISDKTWEIRLTAQVDEPWHIYSQQTPEGGPLPTKVRFTKNPLLLMQGKLKEEGDMEMYHEEVFDVDVYAYTGKVTFVQVVKIKAAKGAIKTNLAGSIEYMACTHEQCLAPATYRFTVTLK